MAQQQQLQQQQQQAGAEQQELAGAGAPLQKAEGQGQPPSPENTIPRQHASMSNGDVPLEQACPQAPAPVPAAAVKDIEMEHAQEEVNGVAQGEEGTETKHAQAEASGVAHGEGNGQVAPTCNEADVALDNGREGSVSRVPKLPGEERAGDLDKTVQGGAEQVGDGDTLMEEGAQQQQQQQEQQ
eukprot:CAMPEP_0202401382 /NCGR_PEP_ID=MMETSP1128-20130828/3443_1 /ASSEMBLY_ACC=CAM_ASM_000463 /TAXON_ID=3047 /ORGANISM="Dunaliella tertiolecta, Strain CCMP1320" /LENGTH=183 /DNA_ID=CAMNT_0049005185 /DNA_START=253 /DNA_END=801 /DNA_ORIENTATION=-